MKMNDDKCNAWILPITETFNVSTGEFELVHIIMDWLRLYPVPRAPDYCKNLFVWQGQLIPLFDMDTFIQIKNGLRRDEIKTAGYICIVAYQCEGEDENIKYGGLLLRAMPFRVTVNDEQASDYPDDNIDWSNVALSCFKDPAFGKVPILNLNRIFSTRPGSLSGAA